MNYYIFIFWSRSEALTFSNSLKKSGLPSALVPTPREAGRTCGLSVKIMPEYYDAAKKMLEVFKYKSFGGILGEVVRNGMKSIIKL